MPYTWQTKKKILSCRCLCLSLSHSVIESVHVYLKPLVTLLVLNRNFLFSGKYETGCERKSIKCLSLWEISHNSKGFYFKIKQREQQKQMQQQIMHWKQLIYLLNKWPQTNTKAITREIIFYVVSKRGIKEHKK